MFDSQSNPVCAAILIDTSSAEQLGRSQSNWFCALSSVGIDADSLVCQSLFEIPSHINLLIIPQSAARILTEQQRLFIMSGVQKGLNVVMEQVSQMSEMIGVYRTEKNRLINSVVDEYYRRLKSFGDRAESCRVSILMQISLFIILPQILHSLL